MLRIGILEPERYPERALDLLRSVGDVTMRPNSVEPFAFIADLNVVILRLKFLINEPLLAHAPALKIISTATTGLDHIDLQAAEKRNITVLSLRGETAFLKTVTATAEHTWGLLLALLSQIPQAHAAVVSGDWDRTKFFGRELQGRTLSIIGLGRIGQMVARYALAFRMRVVAFDPYQKEWVDGVERANSLKYALECADVLSVHVPLSKETTHLIGAADFGSLKRGAIVLNTSRGAVLDETALLDALESGHVGAAALDVIHDEYSPASGLRDRLLRYAAGHQNLLITPHLGGATHDSLEKVEIFMAEKLVHHLSSTS